MKKLLNCQFYSLLYPTKAYHAAGYNRYELAKLNIQLKMFLGRYRTEKLGRHWSDNRHGYCVLGPQCSNTQDTIAHILVSCPVLECKRETLRNSWLEREAEGPLSLLVREICTWVTEDQTAFLLDPLSNPLIISLSQQLGGQIIDKICYLTRTYCFSIHRQRKINLGMWYNSGYPAPNVIPVH